MEKKKHDSKDKLGQSIRYCDKSTVKKTKKGMGFDLVYDPSTKRGVIRGVESYFNFCVTAVGGKSDYFRPVDGKPNTLKEVIREADNFLRMHVGRSYNDFVQQIDAETLTGYSYDDIHLKSRKMRLFEQRAASYLYALSKCEKTGYDVGDVLLQIREKTIPHHGKARDEPAFKEILRLLRGEKEYNQEMAELLRRAYAGRISLISLMNHSGVILEAVMDKDHEGYEDNNKYTALKSVARQLEGLHDAFTIKYFSEHRQELLDMAGTLVK